MAHGTGTATITAKTGPAIQVTTGVFPNISSITFDVKGEVLTIVTNNIIKTFALTGSNTITLTASSGVYTLTVS